MRTQATRTVALTASVLILATASAVSGPARAADADTHTEAVHYQDLNLNSADGEAKLKQRVARAASEVCGPLEGREIADYERFDGCRKTAIANASSQEDAVIASVRSSDHHRYAMNIPVTR
jgi:UrcA family protein